MRYVMHENNANNNFLADMFIINKSMVERQKGELWQLYTHVQSME